MKTSTNHRSSTARDAVGELRSALAARVKTRKPSRGLLPHVLLDRRLDLLARAPEQFTESATRFAEELDALGRDLEISDPESWRISPVPGEARPITPENQLGFEVGCILAMSRSEEGRLARRIELAKIRLDRALAEEGWASSDDADTNRDRSAPSVRVTKDRCSLQPRARRRWTEWHALRLEMVERNLHLVLVNVRRYVHANAGRADLIQEGASVLFQAVDRFDWRRGLLFRTYAVHWLNQVFRSYLYDFGRTVRLPVYIQKLTKHIRGAIARLGDPGATSEQIALVSGLHVEQIEAARAAVRQTLSLDVRTGGSDAQASLGELPSSRTDADPYSTALEDVSLAEGLEEALQGLTARERYVVGRRYGLGCDREHTLAETGQELGLSLERVRQIQARALSKMRTARLRRVVDPFLAG